MALDHIFGVGREVVAVMFLAIYPIKDINPTKGINPLMGLT
jgi:hypothetical protein